MRGLQSISVTTTQRLLKPNPRHFRKGGSVFFFFDFVVTFKNEMNSELSPMTPAKDSEVNSHGKGDLNVPILVDNSTNCIMTMENTNYVTVDGARYAGDFR